MKEAIRFLSKANGLNSVRPKAPVGEPFKSDLRSHRLDGPLAVHDDDAKPADLGPAIDPREVGGAGSAERERGMARPERLELPTRRFEA